MIIGIEINYFYILIRLKEEVMMLKYICYNILNLIMRGMIV